MKRRFFSAGILIVLILLLLRLDYWLAQPEILGRLGIALSFVSLFLVSLAASEFSSLWSNQEPSTSKGTNGTRRLPKVTLLTSASVVMIAIACCLPACIVQFDRWEDALNSSTVQGVSAKSWQSWHPALYSLLGLLTALTWTLGYEMWNFRASPHEVGEITDRLGRSTLVYVYLITLFGFMLPHRWLEGNNALGLISIIGLIATVKMSDSFALFAGKAFGTVKMAPSLSPGKTIQGAVGAFVGSFLAMAIVFFVVAPQVFGFEIDKPWWWFALYTFCITAAGIFGDLAESMLKRDAARKDSSSWIPGLGGILDVLDSLVFACPVSYLLWII